MLPGPSMSLIVSNSILYNKKSSLLSSAGIMFGIAMQSAAVLIGLTLFTQDSLVFTALQFLCSSYLIYLGIRSIQHYNHADQELSHKDNKQAYFIEGFLLEILNPIAFIFFVTILANLVSMEYGWQTKTIYWLEIIIIGSMWFGGLALLSGSDFLLKRLQRYKNHISIISGIIFIAFGIKCLSDCLQQFQI